MNKNTKYSNIGCLDNENINEVNKTTTFLS